MRFLCSGRIWHSRHDSSGPANHQFQGSSVPAPASSIVPISTLWQQRLCRVWSSRALGERQISFIEAVAAVYEESYYRPCCEMSWNFAAALVAKKMAMIDRAIASTTIAALPSASSVTMTTIATLTPTATAAAAMTLIASLSFVPCDAT
mmetsp:Transcript_7786/g.17196  ORF Transcript_7786/g.17196 Transcript_7786/m.17196 type:complete len:149 (-) Transcript_7786:53-499(-)